MMDERIAARIALLEASEQETERQLIMLRVVLAELRALLQVEPPIVTADPLEPPMNADERR